MLTSFRRASSPPSARTASGTLFSNGSVAGVGLDVRAAATWGTMMLTENWTHLCAAVLFSTTSTPRRSRSPLMCERGPSRRTFVQLPRLAFQTTLTEALLVDICAITALCVFDVDLNNEFNRQSTQPCQSRTRSLRVFLKELCYQKWHCLRQGGPLMEQRGPPCCERK